MNDSRYQWRIVQDGGLPLRPDGTFDRQTEHRCNAVLIWPEDAPVTTHNAVIVDPCFTDAGFRRAAGALDAVGAALNDVGRVFVTHLHGDHMLHLPYTVEAPRFRSLRPGSLREDDPLVGLHAEACPGHDRGLVALRFRDTRDRVVWAVGDAVLDESWLRAWNYYYPNGYSAAEIVQTWRSVARILASADVVIPGHGPAFDVTTELLRALLDAFPDAPHADQCPDVAQALRARLHALETQDEQGHTSNHD